MHARKITVLFLSFAGLILATWAVSGQQTRRIDDVALKTAGKTGEDWLTYGLTPQETRYSPLKQHHSSGTETSTPSPIGALSFRSMHVPAKNAGAGILK